ncbi:MAG: hypothetical protein AAF657_17325 [Acidobacteriota bacterium]
MRDRISSSVRISLTVIVLAALAGAPTLAQPPRTTCDGMENLTGMDTTPQSLNVAAPLSDDFTLTGTGCATTGGASVDHVTCFVPENSCLMNFDCLYIPAGAATIAVNVYSGSCTTSPTSCIASDANTNFGSVATVSLTAGTQYCVVCESSVNATNLQLDFDADGGDCGALPVSIQEFSISDLESLDEMEAEVEEAR